MVWVRQKNMDGITPKDDKERGDKHAHNNPFFAEWLQTDFVHVVSKPRVMKAFWKWSAFGDGSSTSRLWPAAIFWYGYSPEITLFDLVCEYEDGSDGGYENYKTHGRLEFCHVGRTWSATSIGIAEPLAALVNDVVGRARHNKGKKKEDPLILEKVEATILHEMIHWSYYVKNREEKTMPGYGGDIEYGTTKFEQEAYGHIMEFDISQLVYVPPTTKPYFGAAMEAVDKPLTITKVRPNFAADRAGVKPGDVLVKFDGRTISTKADFEAQMAKKLPGDTVLVEVRRGAKVITLRVTLDDWAWSRRTAPGK